MTDTICWLPIPEHCGQAPMGLLNENILGSSSGKLMPCSSQAYFCENSISSPSVPSRLTVRIFTLPSEALSALSTESERRERISALKASLSTTISIECLRFLSNALLIINRLNWGSRMARACWSWRSSCICLMRGMAAKSFSHCSRPYFFNHIS